MGRFMAGAILGFFVGAAASAGAAVIAGSDGYLTGWSVTKDGEEICDSPYVWVGTREIECD